MPDPPPLALAIVPKRVCGGVCVYIFLYTYFVWLHIYILYIYHFIYVLYGHATVYTHHIQH